MPDITITLNFSSRSGVWILGLGVHTEVLSTPARLALPRRVQNAMQRVERAFQQEQGRFAPNLPEDAISQEDQSAIDEYLAKGGQVQIVGKQANISLEDLGL